MNGRPFSRAELALIKRRLAAGDNYSAIARDLTGRDASAVRRRALAEGWRTTRLREKRQRWTPEQRAEIALRYPSEPTSAIARDLGSTDRAIYALAHGMGLRKTPEYLASEAGRMQKGVRRSPGTEFKPGHRTWNAGLKGFSPAGSERGRFKPGNRPQTWCPIGTLRLPQKGYLQIKLTDTGNTAEDFVPLHRLMWEQVNGQPVPEGHAVTFRDGNILHLSPANLVLKSRAEVMAGNSIHARLLPEVVDLERLRWALNRRIKKATER